MKAITIQQPYATLIVAGEKKEEWRSWPISYRGPLLVHASKYGHVLDSPELREAADVLAFGAIIGIVTVTDCRMAKGMYRYTLRNALALEEPIPCSGNLGLWEVPKSIAARLKEAYETYEQHQGGKLPA
jgi:hypothetical protein